MVLVDQLSGEYDNEMRLKSPYMPFSALPQPCRQLLHLQLLLTFIHRIHSPILRCRFHLRYAHKRVVVIVGAAVCQNLAAEKTYNNLDISIEQALRHRSSFDESGKVCGRLTLLSVVKTVYIYNSAVR